MKNIDVGYIVDIINTNRFLIDEVIEGIDPNIVARVLEVGFKKIRGATEA